MSNDTEKSREEIKAARDAKKIAKSKAKKKGTYIKIQSDIIIEEQKHAALGTKNITQNTKNIVLPCENIGVLKNNTNITSQDEVDKSFTGASFTEVSMDKSSNNIKTERVAMKPLKNKTEGVEQVLNLPVMDLTVKDVVNTLKDIVNIAKEVQTVTARVEAIDLDTKLSNKVEPISKSKADLRAERRAKQEAQRAAKQAAAVTVPVKIEINKEDKNTVKKEEFAKTKTSEKTKTRPQCVQKLNWFGVNTMMEQNIEESLKKIALNSHTHPAVVRLGVRLATRAVSGSNAKCVALLDAMKQVVRDYSLPARTELGRGLEAAVTQCAALLWQLRPPGAAQLNALSHLRRHLTQLPADVDEFDAKKTLQEEIDRYIREQIDMAGEAVSLAVRSKISAGDNVLTYGCSTLVERILCEAHEAGVQFCATVAGCRVQPAARQLLRRLLARGLRCQYVDVSALTFAMTTVSKVVLGAESLLANGAVLAMAGSLATALAARAHNVPVLVACETHKFSDKVHTDAYLCDEIGDPEELIDKSDENSPLKDWKSIPNLNVFNLMYDITPPSLVTAVVTELGVLPCTSAPVVLRYKLSEYGL